MADEPSELGSREVERLDALYAGFPPVEKWASCPIDAELRDRWTEALRLRREQAPPSALDEALAEARRVAAMDTGAIEGLYATDRGFTVTVARMATARQAEIERTKGADVRRLVEAQLEGYEMALDAATGRVPVSEAWVRQLHEVVCAAQPTYGVTTPVGPQERPLPKGAYKGHPNHVVQADGTTHSYAPVAETGPEMRCLVVALRSPEFDGLHPALSTAFGRHLGAWATRIVREVLAELSTKAIGT